jgi:L-cysteate sulfo-lyase
MKIAESTLMQHDMNNPLSKMLKCDLGFFPTPLHELKRLSKHLGGPRIFIKRDDLSGLAVGGNKTRKLEYLMADAVSKGCDTVVTAGAAQSNHCRQTAAAAARLGLKCHLLLGGEEYSKPNGNLLLDYLLGAEIHWSGEHRKGEKLPELIHHLESEGCTPYFIPYGGSNEIGALGFVDAFFELHSQMIKLNLKVDQIVFASSSGATQAGLTVGSNLKKQNNDLQLIGIAIDKGETGEVPFDENIVMIANATSKKLGLTNDYSKQDFILKNSYVGAGYGVVGSLEREAILLLAQKEGILVDPVYTGRAFGGLLDMVDNKVMNKNEVVVFWHTGGTPALFYHAEEFSIKEISSSKAS